MASDTLKRDKTKNMLSGMSIAILGQRRFQNELLAFFLENDADANCSVGQDFSNIARLSKETQGQPELLLIECPEKDYDIFINELDSLEKDTKSFSQPVALFNVSHGIGIEERAVSLGVRGIFYIHDPIERFRKGIGAILKGELWVSREVLTKYVMENRQKEKVSSQEETVLTSREIEILAMISAGAKNEDIAEKLCISPNTVKTHIYNIFKQIGVPNRLQAALWAAKNL